jgi:stage III sporulation protein AE
MKKIIVVLTFMLLFTPAALAEEEIFNASNGVSGGTIENVQRILPGFTFENAAVELMKGQLSGGIKGVFESIRSILLGEVYSNMKLLGAILVIGAICAIITSMQSGFLSEGTRNAVVLVCYLMIMGLAVEGFLEVANMGKQVVEDMSIFMMTAVPSLGGLSVASGSAVSGGMLIPMAMFASGICSQIMSKICLPGLYLSLAVSLVSGISERLSLRELGQIIRKASLWLLTGVVTVSIAIITISGFASGTLDGITTKGVKFATSSLVPVLGGTLADAADVVAGSALILKNASGAAGMIFIILMLIYPILKIAAVGIMYKLTAALLALVADKKVPGALNDMSDVLSAMTGMLFADGVGMIIMIAAIINTSNMGAMLR